jgi:hypothetical protein
MAGCVVDDWPRIEIANESSTTVTVFSVDGAGRASEQVQLDPGDVRNERLAADETGCMSSVLEARAEDGRTAVRPSPQCDGDSWAITDGALKADGS